MLTKPVAAHSALAIFEEFQGSLPSFSTVWTSLRLPGDSNPIQSTETWQRKMGRSLRMADPQVRNRHGLGSEVALAVPCQVSGTETVIGWQDDALGLTLAEPPQFDWQTIVRDEQPIGISQRND